MDAAVPDEVIDSVIPSSQRRPAAKPNLDCTEFYSDAREQRYVVLLWTMCELRGIAADDGTTLVMDQHERSILASS